MSEFSTDWLCLREPCDAAARNKDLLADLAAWTCARDVVAFSDLGCGTGANLRHTALTIDRRVLQRWELFDHDKRLLEAARESVAAWADKCAEPFSKTLELEKDGRRLEVTFHQVDLSGSLDGIIEPGQIVTASAFFDLVSADWIDHLVRAAAAARATVYAPLIYNGFEAWSPPHPGDGPMLAAFHVHQHRDKGFGPACGPKATASLEKALRTEGYNVKIGDSPWHLGPTERPIIEMLADGSAAAVAELNLFDEDRILAWRESRCNATSTIIGHSDVLGFPPAG